MNCGAINGFVEKIYINVTCSSSFCLDWTIPPNVRAVYIFRLGGWGFEPQSFICHLNVFPTEQNCSKDPHLRTDTYEIRSDRTISLNVLPVYTFPIEAGLGFFDSYLIIFFLFFFFLFN